MSQNILYRKPLIAFLICEGFEDMEFAITYDICKRAGLNCWIYSVDNTYQVRSSNGMRIYPNDIFNNMNLNMIDGIVIPGGQYNVERLMSYLDVLELIKIFYKQNKLVAAICAGPMVLAKAKILKEHKFTCYPSKKIEKKALCNGGRLKKNFDVVIDNNIITSKGPFTSFAFAFSIVKYFYKNDLVLNVLKKNLLFSKKY